MIHDLISAGAALLVVAWFLAFGFAAGGLLFTIIGLPGMPGAGIGTVAGAAFGMRMVTTS